MVTETAADLVSSWTRDPAEKLETCLAQIKHQGEPKIWHSKPIDWEGFSMPQSNKRRAGLPNPHPVGLPRHCSILLGSLLLRLRQATAPCQAHAWWDPHILGHAGPMTTSIPTPQLCQIPTPSRSSPRAHRSSGSAGPQLCMGWLDSCPLGSPPLRPRWAPVPCGMTEAPLAGTGTSLAWDSCIYQPTGIPAPRA
jgi:hypothetical protein